MKFELEEKMEEKIEEEEEETKYTILNLTQHEPTEDQRRAGVFQPTEGYIAKIRELLTFESMPTIREIERRAEWLAYIANRHLRAHQVRRRCMIGGAPFLLSALERELKERGIQPVYAFSQRVSEEKEVDGKIVKTQVFKHLGFVEVGYEI